MKKLVQKIRQVFKLRSKSDFYYLEEEIKYRGQYEQRIVKARLEGTKAA